MIFVMLLALFVVILCPVLLVPVIVMGVVMLPFMLFSQGITTLSYYKIEADKQKLMKQQLDWMQAHSNTVTQHDVTLRIRTDSGIKIFGDLS